MFQNILIKTAQK